MMKTNPKIIESTAKSARRKATVKLKSAQSAKTQDGLETLLNGFGETGFNQGQTVGLTNCVTGLGTQRSKLTHNQWQFPLLNAYEQLEAAYVSSWLARRVVDGKAEDMTREWRTVKSDGAEDIQNAEKAMSMQFHVREAISWARLYGGAGIVIFTNQLLNEPLNVNLIKKGDLLRFQAFDRWDLQSMTINTWDILADNYLEPEFYTVSGGGQQIHHSHVARFLGAELPRRRRAQTLGWGDSELRKCLADINELVSSKSGISELMQEANLDVITRQGLSEDLASDQDEAIQTRYQIYGMMKSIFNLSLLDGDEELERLSLNFGGVADVLETLMTFVSGCAGYPVTKLFGTSAKGMNATGEGDLKNYNDDIRSLQQKIIGPMRTIDEVLVRSAVGHMPDDFDYIWNPLAQPNTVEEAQAALLRAQKDAIYLQDGIATRSQVMRNLQAEEAYQYDDGMIDELENMEDPTMFDEPMEPEEGDPAQASTEEKADTAGENNAKQ